MNKMPALKTEKEIVNWFLYESDESASLRENLSGEEVLDELSEKFVKILAQCETGDDYFEQYLQSQALVNRMKEALAPYQALGEDERDEETNSRALEMILTAEFENVLIRILHYIGEKEFDRNFSEEKNERGGPGIADIIESSGPPSPREFEVLINWAVQAAENDKGRDVLESDQEILSDFVQSIYQSLQENYKPEKMVQAFQELIVELLLCDMIRNSYEEGEIGELNSNQIFPVDQADPITGGGEHYQLAFELSNLLKEAQEKLDWEQILYAKHLFFSVSQILYQLFLENKYNVNTQEIIQMVGAHLQSQFGQSLEE